MRPAGGRTKGGQRRTNRLSLGGRFFRINSLQGGQLSARLSGQGLSGQPGQVFARDAEVRALSTAYGRRVCPDKTPRQGRTTWGALYRAPTSACPLSGPKAAHARGARWIFRSDGRKTHAAGRLRQRQEQDDERS